MHTNFQLTSKMNEAFGNSKGDPCKIQAKKLLSQCTNIASEYKELMHAFGINVDVIHGERDPGAKVSIDDIRDALCDIMVFAYGAYHIMGFDADRDMREVIDCVMTRFCKNPEEMKLTTAHYDKMGVTYYLEGQYPRVCLKSYEDQGDGEYPKGKFLKAVGYKKPTFYQYSPVVETVPTIQLVTTPTSQPVVPAKFDTSIFVNPNQDPIPHIPEAFVTTLEPMTIEQAKQNKLDTLLNSADKLKILPTYQAPGISDAVAAKIAAETTALRDLQLRKNVVIAQFKAQLHEMVGEALNDVLKEIK